MKPETIPATQHLTILREKGTSETFHLEQDASLTYIFFADEKKEQQIDLNFFLEGPHASLLLIGFDLRYAQSTNVQLNIFHKSPHTTAHAFIRSALFFDTSSKVYGRIVIEKQAQNADASFTHNILLLSEKAQGKTEPILEIQANDIKAKHAATVGGVSKDDTFYLLSRGIPPDASEKLLVEGFFQKYIEKIPEEEIKEKSEKLLAQKLGSQGRDNKPSTKEKNIGSIKIGITPKS